MAFNTFLFLLFLIPYISEIGATPTANSTTAPKPTPQNSSTIPLSEGGNSSSISATIYTMAHFHGIWWTLDLSKGCEDLPGLLVQKASSIDTHDACVILYPEVGCKGQNVTVAPGTSGHSDLGMLTFDNLLSSMKPCSGNDHKNVTSVSTTTPFPKTTPWTTPKNPAQQKDDENEENVKESSGQIAKKGATITLSHIIY